MERLICLAVGYAFGNFPTGYVYAKMKGVDIRKVGSGNIGTTNALRTLGAKAGLLTMLGDIIKTLIPLFATCYLFREKADMRYLLTVYTGLGVILGHNFPATLHFHGGKGVACTAALVIFSDPVLLLVCAIAFFGCLAVTRYVSLSSLLAGSVFFAANVILVLTGRRMGWGGNEPLASSYHVEFFVVCAVVTGLIIFQHRSNIQRLLSGTERKFSVGGRKEKTNG